MSREEKRGEESFEGGEKERKIGRPFFQSEGGGKRKKRKSGFLSKKK